MHQVGGIRKRLPPPSYAGVNTSNFLFVFSFLPSFDICLRGPFEDLSQFHLLRPHLPFESKEDSSLTVTVVVTSRSQLPHPIQPPTYRAIDLSIHPFVSHYIIILSRYLPIDFYLTTNLEDRIFPLISFPSFPFFPFFPRRLQIQSYNFSIIW